MAGTRTRTRTRWVLKEPLEAYSATHRYARISARKARLVMDLIRGDPVEQALLKLECSPRRASPMVRKVVLSAVANAAQMGGVEPESLVVHQAFADDGPIMKRWRPRSMGRAFPILKRTSHLSVVVATVERRDAAGSDAGGRQGAQAQSRAEGEARG